MAFYYSEDGVKQRTYVYCSWCQKPVTRDFMKDLFSKKYHACSRDCQNKLSSFLQSKDWTGLNERQRWLVSHVGFKAHVEKWNLWQHSQAVKSLTVAKPSKKAKVERIILKNPENMLQAHSEALKDDPEKMDAAFLERIMGWGEKEVKK